MCRTFAALAFAGFRVWLELTAVPDVKPMIQIVIEDATALGAVAVDSRDRPRRSARRGHAAAVEFACDRAAAVAGGILFKDEAHPTRLRLVDFQTMTVLADRNRAVTVRQPTGKKAARELTVEAAMHLGAQVIEVDFIDQPTHTTVQLACLGLRVIAVRDADQANADMLEPAHNTFLFNQIT
ncbi:MAG: hypothetical protein Q7J84_13945 [Sulfuricaulis sp.]|nr:hypothetical protein [Sulfuricaulis sp.]